MTGVEVGGLGEFVRVEVADAIATIRLDRPKMNALNAQVQDEIAAAAAEVSQDAAVRAVILYGGERVFAAGADIKEMEQLGYSQMAERSARLQASFSAVADIPKPVVAAVTGYALSGGLELALCADFRVLGENAKVGQPEILLGVIPGAGGTQRLPRLIGEARATEMILTGRTVEADEAERIGLVNKAVSGDLLEAGQAFAREMTGFSLPVLGLARDAIRRAHDLPLHDGLKIEADLSTLAFQTADSVEGMTAFIEKRKPVFRDG